MGRPYCECGRVGDHDCPIEEREQTIAELRSAIIERDNQISELVVASSVRYAAKVERERDELRAEVERQRVRADSATAAGLRLMGRVKRRGELLREAREALLTDDSELHVDCADRIAAELGKGE